MLEFLPFLVTAYLLGSIPSAVLYARIFHGIDIRDHGSGNAGATNSLRVMGKKAGAVVLIFDMLKGITAVLIARFFLGNDLETLMIIGFVAVIGHLLPVFAKFRGGKGVATSFGIMLAIHPLGALFSLIVFITVVKLTRYVSLSSLLGSFAFLLFSFFQSHHSLLFSLLCLALFLVLVFTHRQNIKRLLARQENKI